MESSTLTTQRPAEELSDSGSSDSIDTPDTSLCASPVLASKDIPALPTPFFPASLEQDELNRQCPTLPPEFPPVPYNATPRSAAVADVNTPDAWINRAPELIRLTGKHPFNSEGPLSSLYQAGFLTPAHLHVVRNHGAVPKISPTTAYMDWKITIHGLISKPITLSVHDLSQLFTVRTFPVSICCAGNRRKEQNVVRKSLGFDWGSAGISTSLWTGVYLADILEYVGVDRKKAKHVIFEGADSGLPKGPYGTSQKLSWALNRDKAMLIAWAMNGLPLEPDHGFPVRLVVPGQIGGRMVKWLTRIEVSDVESNHHLHYWDNKVLPMQLTPEQARKEPKWWYDPRYIITELNVNSAIVKPGHAETLFIPSAAIHSEEQTYTVQGFAYAGGGRRISRVELSLDDGHTWDLAEVDYPEDKFRTRAYEHPIYGLIDLTERDTCFCWCFWTWVVPVSALAGSSVLTMRAMDEAMNAQPRNMYLNPTSMLNNWWFRIAIQKEEKEDGVTLFFEHPAPVGEQPIPGWMERMRAEGKDILKPVFSSDGSEQQENTTQPAGAVPKLEVSMVRSDVTRKITPEEVRAHDKEKPWFVVNGEVYDPAGYVDEHPGGPDSIILVAGQDATEDFMAIHSADAKKKLAEYHIGTLTAPLMVQQADSAEAMDDPFIDPQTWKTVSLASIERVNHDSLVYRFVFPEGAEERPLGLPVGQHVFVRLRHKTTGEIIQRAYTPVSREGAKGGVELLVKLYLPTAHWPEGGKMTVAFNELKVGDTAEIKGPLGSFVWKGKGVVSWRGKVRELREIGLVCGGSGITPILQILRAVIAETSGPELTLYVLSANKTEEDILCREEMDLLHSMHSSRLRVFYVLSSLETLTDQWLHGRGRISEQMLRDHLPSPPSQDDCGKMVLSCGPPGMIDSLKQGLSSVGWRVERDFVVF